jgi:uncharacterized protein (DUF1778 family)
MQISTCTSFSRTIEKSSLSQGERIVSQPESAAAHHSSKTGKSERLEARLSREQKELLQYAADLEGRSLTDFVVSHAQTAAVRAISEHTVIKLSRADSIAFAESLLSPTELPADAPLARAISRYQQSQGME